MIDLDITIDPEMLRVPDDMYLSLGDRDYPPTVKFRYVCGPRGYVFLTNFVDHEGCGSGTTPREALRSLARSLRDLADRADRAAEGPKP